MDLIKTIYRKTLSVLPDKLANGIIFFRGYKKIMNLKEPIYLGEKIQWLKIHGQLEELGNYVDKYEVRNFVENTIGKKYLINIFGVYNSVEEIEFDKLPNRFVLKCTNGSQAVIICKDKSKLDIEKAKREMKKWLKGDFYKIKKEYQYKNVKNRIIIEEYLEDESGDLRDYKFYCINGEPYCYSVFSDRFTDKTTDMYDKEGNWLPDILNGGPNSKIKGKRPPRKLDNLDEMFDISRKLSKLFTFVRVDFYIVEGKVYFGELTFTDGAGGEPIKPLSFDAELARDIKLEPILKRNIS